jgi:hypothetical protein
MKVSFNVRRQIGRFLAAKNVPEAIQAMETADLPFISGTSDRIQFALLLLARGNCERFKSELKQAQIDWRDTLVAAGLANEDWRDVLASLGIEFNSQ